MPLDADDAVTLSPRAQALARELTAALAEDGDGGKRITRAEKRRIVTALGELLICLVRDLLD